MKCKCKSFGASLEGNKNLLLYSCVVSLDLILLYLYVEIITQQVAWLVYPIHNQGEQHRI